MKGRRVVVPGGAGFIGSNLTRVLSEQNEVIVIDDLSTGKIENIRDIVDDKKIEFIKGSITDLDLLQETFKDVDFVFHEAAISSVPRSVKDPIRSNEANVNGTLNVLVAARDNGVKKVVYASSSSIYCDTPTLPKKEDMPPCPLSPYAVSKLTGEQYCQVFTQVYGLPTACLRYFNVYGPRQDSIGEYAAVIPKFITNVLADKPPVIFDDGEQTRDFTFVSDAVQANMLAAEGTSTGVYNIAGGTRISINKLAQAVMEAQGIAGEPIYDKPRPGDIKHSLADISKAEDAFGYEIQFDLSKGLGVTVDWFQQ